MSFEVRKPSGHRALRRGRTSLPGHYYHLTTTTFERQPWFASFTCACLVSQVIQKVPRYFDTQLLAWVLMPDHLHLLIQLGEKDHLSRFMQRLKTQTANQLNIHLARHGSVWGRGFYDHALRADENIQQIARYIIANPLRAGLVDKIGDYPFWDAVWLDQDFGL